MNLTGIILGFAMLFLIGFGFFWVIKLEYTLGAQSWKWVFVLGFLLCVVSLWMPSFWASALIGILGGSIIWGAIELPEQEQRVQRGLFPENPNRKQRGKEK